MTRKRKNYTPEEKVAILRRHLEEKQFFENGAAAFQRKGKRRSPTPEARKLEKLEAKLTQKNEVLAELMQEHVQLKKEIGEL